MQLLQSFLLNNYKLIGGKKETEHMRISVSCLYKQGEKGYMFSPHLNYLQDPFCLEAPDKQQVLNAICCDCLSVKHPGLLSLRGKRTTRIYTCASLSKTHSYKSAMEAPYRDIK